MGELIVNSDSYPDRVSAARKACTALVKELGMTRTDLRPMLQTKLTEFIQDENNAGEYFDKNWELV